MNATLRGEFAFFAVALVWISELSQEPLSDREQCLLTVYYLSQ